jgi:hypothetical protein
MWIHGDCWFHRILANRGNFLNHSWLHPWVTGLAWKLFRLRFNYLQEHGIWWHYSVPHNQKILVIDIVIDRADYVLRAFAYMGFLCELCFCNLSHFVVVNPKLFYKRICFFIRGWSMHWWLLWLAWCWWKRWGDGLHWE